VRHARSDDLERLGPLLAQLRTFDALTERTPGSFYKGSAGFLHFHIDGDDVYADVKLNGSTFDRTRVTTQPEQAKLVRDLKRALAN
jgi:hypothetical protein